KTLPADSLILDLEDSVAPEAKEAARSKVCAAVKAGGYGERELVIRANALETPWGAGDLFSVAQSGAAAVLVPKGARPRAVTRAATVRKAAAAPGGRKLGAMVEPPAAILNAREIAAVAGDAALGFECLIMGTNDLLKESRARSLGDRFAVVPWLAMTIVAAR